MLNEAVVELLESDLIANPGDLFRTSERNVTARLRDIVERHIRRLEYRHNVDHEHTRMGPNAVTKYSVIMRGSISPDIIVHKRTITHNMDTSANLLVVEVKMIPLFDGIIGHINNKKQRNGLIRDMDKLTAMQSPADNFQYVYAASLVFARSGVWVSLNGSRHTRLRLP